MCILKKLTNDGSISKLDEIEMIVQLLTRIIKLWSGKSFTLIP